MNVKMNTSDEIVKIPLTEIDCMIKCNICSGFLKNCVTMKECLHSCKWNKALKTYTLTNHTK